MEQFEKVCKGLECCSDEYTDCTGCPYDDGELCNGGVGLKRDTLALFRQQQERIKELEAAQQWISVKDRLPETNDEVLTTYVYADKPRKRYVETESYWDDGDGEGHWSSVWDEYRVGNARQTVIAWMPLPKPYKPPKEET
jgi:hypothetical protein